MEKRIEKLACRLVLPVMLCALASCSVLNRKSLLESELERRNEARAMALKEEQDSRKLRKQMEDKFRLIRQLIKDRRFLEAENRLAGLEAMEEFKEEIDDLHELLALAKRQILEETDLEVDKSAMLTEAKTNLYLPDTYNTTEYISEEEVKETVGTLESLLDKPVTLKVAGKPLSEFAMELKDLEGINMGDPVNTIFNDKDLEGLTFTANFKDVPLQEVFDFISYQLSVNFNIHGNILWVTKAAKPAEGPRLFNKVIHLPQGIIPTVPEGMGVATGAKAAFETTKEDDLDLDNALKAFFAKSTTGGSYLLFPQRNLLMVTDTLANIREVENLVRVFCKPPYQVLIETKFIMVSESDLHDVGVELTHRNGGKKGADIQADNQENANVSDFFTKLGALAANNEEGLGSLMVSGILGNRSFDMLITALQKKSSTMTLSEPRVVVLNNRTARIRKGDKLMYFEEYALQSINRGEAGTETLLVPTGKPTSMPVGITFDVKPSVGADAKTVLLGLKPEIVSFLQWEDYASTETTTTNKVTTTTDVRVMLPRTHEQTLATSIRIGSGETVILGGMVENRETVSVNKVPILGDIPYLGTLFRHTVKNSQPTNLLIFLTATIINEKGEYVIVKH